MATEAITLEKDAFMRMVTEEHLQVEGPSAGYLYAGKHGKNGWELYKTANNPWYLWTYRQVCTQDNVGGGNLICRITAPSGGQMRLVEMRWTTSGNRAIQVYIYDGDGNAHVVLAIIGATAGCSASLPSIGSAATASNNTVQSKDLLIGGNSQIRGTVTAAAQTETATISTMWLVSENTRPTVVWTDSTGTPNAAAATRNTLELVAIL